MVLDFVTTYAIQAWGLPQGEGMRFLKGKVRTLFSQGRCLVSLRLIRHDQRLGSAIHQSGI